MGAQWAINLKMAVEAARRGCYQRVRAVTDRVEGCRGQVSQPLRASQADRSIVPTKRQSSALIRKTRHQLRCFILVRVLAPVS